MNERIRSYSDFYRAACGSLMERGIMVMTRIPLYSCHNGSSRKLASSLLFTFCFSSLRNLDAAIVAVDVDNVSQKCRSCLSRKQSPFDSYSIASEAFSERPQSYFPWNSII